MIGKHTLDCEKDGLRASRFGVKGVRGSSGRMAYTRSVGHILAAAGLISAKEAAQVGENLKIEMKKTGERWNQVEGGRGRRQPHQMSTFQTAVHNRFAPLQDFC